ncbi:MAG: DUF4336 domain-containing protein [Rhodospirillum sp.]|nr:DUF4336 domain-containing protein [Rhodospirillum sp.]MCF8489511.1 DUF4336 domain-containing protein [Rhodospirillum sp.]MCF8500566.1 DUF4336 domain-containing protein [Rhodospirillum sp.]
MVTLTPYAPLNVPKALAEDLWIVDGPVTHMRYLFWTLPFTTRSTVIRLPGGGLWVHSPTRLTSELKASVDGLGPVTDLVAPNKIHWEGLAAWKAAYPKARIRAAPGVVEKETDGGFTVDEVLGATPPTDWGGVIDMRLVPGDFMTEAVFLHRPSASLILTDLYENFAPDRVTGAGMRVLMRLGGVLHPHGGTPRDLRLTFLSRRAEVREAARAMVAWAPRRIILSHGDLVEAGASGPLEPEIRRIFAWTGL